MHYILDGKDPIEEDDVLTWARWFETADRIVEQTALGRGVRVSTIFLGLDHRFVGGGPPLLFETMIFGGERDGAQWRYATWDEAIMGHDAAVDGLDRWSLSRLLRRLHRLWNNLRRRVQCYVNASGNC